MRTEMHKTMRCYSIFHAILSIAAMVVLHIITKDVFTTILLYAVVLMFLPKLLELIGQIGFYETDRAVFGVGEDAHIEVGDFVEFYGPIRVLLDMAMYVVGCTLPVTILGFILPQTIYLLLLGTVIVILLFHFVVYPLIKDAIWIFAKEDPSQLVTDLYGIIVTVIVILGIVSTIIYAGYHAKVSKDYLDVNALLAEHFSEERNPYMDMDMNDVQVEFSKLGTEAELIFNQPIVSNSGIAYPGSKMSFTYHSNDKTWKMIHHFTGNPEIVSEAVYIGENELEIGGYSGLAQIEITVLSKKADGGYGIFKIIDKETSTVVYSSPFSFTDYNGGATGEHMSTNVTFENPLNLGPWDTYDEDFTWITIDHIYFYMNTVDFDLFLQE